MQSDILGASALGIRNVLCLSGDHQVFGNQKEAKNVYDVDAIGELMMFKKMRDECQVWGGDKLEKPPQLFLGAAANPFADPFEYRVVRLAKKVSAGADFIQTQSIYDMERFEKWMAQVRARGLHEKVHIIAGVMPLKSPKVALYMKNKVSGMIVPDAVVDRMKAATDPKDEGIKMCVEQIKHVLSIEGVHGVHVMAVAWEEKVPEIVRDAGLLPRPPTN
jgi:methylenetetrahydrofolate reductase (NADPH)